MGDPTESPFADSERNEADALAQGATIVSASATMTAVGDNGPKTGLTMKIEAAMVAAVEQAAADGVTDPEEIKARKLAARDAVLAG